jgi:glycine cleavage system protein P-like pyridoxal-binding family
MMGSNGLTDASRIAILNANCMAGGISFFYDIQHALCYCIPLKKCITMLCLLLEDFYIAIYTMRK